MKSYKRFAIESHQILEQTTANPAKPNTLRRAGRFVRANLRAGIQSARAQTPSTPIPSTSVPATQTASSLAQRSSSRVLPRIASRAGVPAVTALVSGVSEYQRRRAEGESDAEAKRNAAIIAGSEAIGGWGGGSIAAGLAAPSGPGAAAAGLGGGWVGSTATGSLARTLLPTPKERKERMNQSVVSARQQLAKQKQYGATSGAGIRGIGGRTVISKPNEKGAAFISTGVGRQRRTAQLPSTMSLPGGRVGDLAFRGGKATYLVRPSIEQQRQDPLSRFARATNLLGFADRERSRQVADVKRAEANTRAYYNRLGVPLSRQNQMPGLKPQARPATTQTTRPAAAPAVPASTPSQGIAQARERLRMRRG